MGDVGVLHEVVAVADDGGAARDSATVGGCVLAKDVVVANPQERLGAAERQILRLATEDGTRMDDVALTDLGRAAENGVRHHPRAGTDAHGALDDDVRADRGGRMDVGVGADDCGRVDHVDPLSFESPSSGGSGSAGSPGTRYCSFAQLPRSINWQRSEQNGR